MSVHTRTTTDAIVRRRGKTRPDTPSLCVSRQEAAAITGWPQSTVYDLITSGTLPVVRLPHTRRLWIKRSDLLSLIERSTERGAQ